MHQVHAELAGLRARPEDCLQGPTLQPWDGFPCHMQIHLPHPTSHQACLEDPVQVVHQGIHIIGECVIVLKADQAGDEGICHRSVFALLLCPCRQVGSELHNCLVPPLQQGTSQLQGAPQVPHALMSPLPQCMRTLEILAANQNIFWLHWKITSAEGCTGTYLQDVWAQAARQGAWLICLKVGLEDGGQHLSQSVVHLRHTQATVKHNK